MKKFMKKSLVLVLCLLMMTAGILSGCTNSSSRVITPEEADAVDVMTVGTYKVGLDDVYLYLIQYVYNNSLSADSVDETMKTSIMNAVMEQMKLELVEYQLALVSEMDLTEEETKQATDSANGFISFFGEEFLQNYGISTDAVNELFVRQILCNKITNKAVADLSEDYVKQYQEDYKDMKFHSVYYALFPSIEYDENKQIVKDDAGNNVTLSETAIAEQKSKAEELRQRAVEGLASGDENETMELLTIEYGIDHCSGIERNYDGAHDQQLNDVIASLNNGDISEVIETPAGYMVVRMDNSDDQDYKTYMINYLSYQSAQNLLPTMQDSWFTQAGADKVVANEEEIAKVDMIKLCKVMEEKGLWVSAGESK